MTPFSLRFALEESFYALVLVLVELDYAQLLGCLDPLIFLIFSFRLSKLHVEVTRSAITLVT